MDLKDFFIRICVWLSYSPVIYCYANTVNNAFTLNSWTKLISAEFFILLFDLVFIIIFFVFCLIIEPGEIKESIEISKLPEKSKYNPPDSIDKKDIKSAKLYLCYFCNMYRSPHVFHCRDCNKCILYMWDHNYLFGKCVGYYNLKFFTNLSLYIGIGLIITFGLDYEIMKTTKTPYYGMDLIFVFILSPIYGTIFLYAFWYMIKPTADISEYLYSRRDIFGSTIWYENVQVFFGKNFWTWFLPIKVPQIESLTIDLRFNTHYGGIIKVKDKFIV